MPGPVGATGLTGIQGVVGSRGAEGPSREGPAGPIGATGATGAQGSTGFTGATGGTEMAGLTGRTGATGPTGPQGSVGQTGAQGMGGSTGAMGMVAPSWSYTFRGIRDDISASDSGKAQEVANFMQQNPSTQVTLSGPARRYTDSVGEALRNAGVPASRIQRGAFTDPNVNNGHRVDVMVSN